MSITERLLALGYAKNGSFEKGWISGTKPFGEYGMTTFIVLLDTPQGFEVANRRTQPNKDNLNNWQENLTVEEMELALEIIYCYREWKGEQNV